MTPGPVRSWIVKGTLIAILLSAGWLFHRVTLQPDPSRLRTFAEDALVEIFGPDVRHGAVSVDVLDGVRIDDLRVQALGASEPGFSAERVVVHHDALALAAGVLTLRSVSIRGPKVSVHESADGGVAPDFPFTLPPAEGKGPPPSLFVERGTLRLVASEHSSTFRGGYALEMSDFHLTALPD